MMTKAEMSFPIAVHGRRKVIPKSEQQVVAISGLSPEEIRKLIVN